MKGYSVNKIGHALRIAVGITALVLLLAGGAGAATLTVCPSGCIYSSIQGAINAANGSDTVQVQNGTYFESVNVNKQLTLRGIGMPVVDAMGNGNAITLSADGIIIEGFTATGGGSFYPEAGIRVNSNNNTLIGNHANSNGYNGITLDYSSNGNTLNGNNASNNLNGIYLYSSSNNTLSSNNANSNPWDGIYLGSSSNNTLSGNTANSNNNGIYLYSSSNNTLGSNNANSNSYGIYLYSSSDNTLLNNTMTANSFNFGLDGWSDSDFNNQIDYSNTVDGKPIYYVKNAINTVYDSSTNAGTFYCIKCVNVTLKNLDLKANIWGVVFWNTTNSNIQNINASNNDGGIYLYSSSNNNIYNNIFNNTNNIGISNSISTWNTTKTPGNNIIGGSFLGGNVWANPGGAGFSQTCADADNDGICDSPYVLDASNIDYLTLAYKTTNLEIDTIGIYRNGVFYLRNSNTAGNADLAFAYGESGDIPVVGDWNGDGIDTIGVYRDGVFYLRNNNSAGIADLAFAYGQSGDIPVVGDWNGDNITTGGVYRNGVFYLRNNNSAGIADLAFAYGNPGDIPVVGDWNGDGIDTIGVYRNGVFYLRNSNTAERDDINFAYGQSGDIPVVGHW
ncbi:MAG: right-handed parallel beta-helix repeat-containing protein [Candidatus Methanoperedens sp.]|nr:right-handed parallel beta-helix repeat-containing protein [Candidatus Methanoperedens sp.]